MTSAAVATDINFTRHAVERFQQRVRPALSVEQAATELGQLASCALLRPEPSGWARGTFREDTTMYLELGDALFPLVPAASAQGAWYAVTCIARSGISEATRERRNRRRRERGNRR